MRHIYLYYTTYWRHAFKVISQRTVNFQKTQERNLNLYVILIYFCIEENQVKFVLTVLPRKERKQPYQKNFTVPKNSNFVWLQYSKKWAIDVRKTASKDYECLKWYWIFVKTNRKKVTTMKMWLISGEIRVGSIFCFKVKRRKNLNTLSSLLI